MYTVTAQPVRQNTHSIQLYMYVANIIIILYQANVFCIGRESYGIAKHNQYILCMLKIMNDPLLHKNLATDIAKTELSTG